MSKTTATIVIRSTDDKLVKAVVKAAVESEARQGRRVQIVVEG